MHLQIPLEPEGKVHLYIELKPAVQGKLQAFMSSFEPFVIAPGCVAIALVCFFVILLLTVELMQHHGHLLFANGMALQASLLHRKASRVTS